MSHMRYICCWFFHVSWLLPPKPNCHPDNVICIFILWINIYNQAFFPFFKNCKVHSQLLYYVFINLVHGLSTLNLTLEKGRICMALNLDCAVGADRFEWSNVLPKEPCTRHEEFRCLVMMNVTVTRSLGGL